MSYLLAHNWLTALLAAVAGFVLTWLWMVRRVEGTVARTVRDSTTVTSRRPGVTGSVAGAVGAATGAAAGVATGAAAAATGAVSGVRDRAVDGGASVTGRLGDGLDRVRGGIDRTGDTVTSRTGDALDRAREVGDGIGDTVTSRTGDALDRARDGVGDGIDRTGDALDRARDGIGDGVGRAGDGVTGRLGHVADIPDARVSGEVAGAALAGTAGAGYVASRFGHGSIDPLPDGSMPDGYAIKGNADSMLFHTVESPSYRQTIAEVWFASEEDARAAGFRHWDPKRR